MLRRLLQHLLLNGNLKKNRNLTVSTIRWFAGKGTCNHPPKCPQHPGKSTKKVIAHRSQPCRQVPPCAKKPVPPVCQPCHTCGCKPPCPPCPSSKPCVGVRRICPPPCSLSSPIPYNPCCPTSHHGNYRKYRTFFVAMLPIIFLLSLYSLGNELPHKKTCREYVYMRRRTKRFPWGEGNKSLFHNDHTNSLPEECEPPPLLCEEAVKPDKECG